MSHSEAWPDETPEELLAKLEKVHGKEAAKVVYRFMYGEIPYTRKRSKSINQGWTEGKKPPRRPRVAQGRKAKTQGVSWRERSLAHEHDEYLGPRNPSGLPRSGAPKAPRHPMRGA